MLRSSIASAFILFLSLFVHTWAAPAGAQPVVRVKSTSNQIFEGVVQLAPGDQMVSITFEIVPEAGVTKYDAFFITLDAGITVDDCAKVDDQSLAFCPPPVEEGDPEAFAFTFPEFDPPRTAGFDIGTVVISVAGNVASGDAIETTGVGQTASFIQEGLTITPIGGQLFATVVPEPSAGLLAAVSLATLGAVARSRRAWD
jgi:hypothetical protein